jgi:transcriptional regulator with XRE-family HTH domain
MAKKQSKSSNPSKETKPHLIPLARYIRQTITDGGYSINSFAKIIGVNNSTLSNVVHAYYPPGSSYIEKLAEEMNKLGVRDEEITSSFLLRMILPEGETAPRKQPKSKPERQPPNIVLHHLRRLTPQERGEIWAPIFELAARDQNQKQTSENISPLVEAIQSAMEEWEAANLEEFAEQILGEQSTTVRRRDFEPLVKGLKAIVEQQRLPRFLTEEFAVALDYLATVLVEGKYAGDVNSLLDYFFSEARGDQQVGA